MHFWGVSLSQHGCGRLIKCFNLRVESSGGRNGRKTEEEEPGESSLLFSLPVRSGGALHLMPAIRLCVANEESTRHTH